MPMLPIISVRINQMKLKTLVDSGCQQSVIAAQALNQIGIQYRKTRTIVSMLNGETTNCLGEVSLEITIGKICIRLLCLVAPTLVFGCSFILGIDGISKLGGVNISSDLSVRFSRDTEPQVAAMATCDDSVCEIDDSDFLATFDGNKWTVRWKWSSSEPVLKNQCNQYKVDEECSDKYELEINQWIEDGWLELHNEAVHGKVEGVIPLMAVIQPNKQRKVRPVMDYSRELNLHINSNPGVEVAVCQDKLRKWRQYSENSVMLDLKKAYLQLHIDRELQRFQAVRHKGKLYVMTRMGFGLNIAPKVMTKILSKVLSIDARIDLATDHYIDDIIVNQDVVSVDLVQEHLARYGLVTKDPEPICNARVLGLRVEKASSGHLVWKRDNTPFSNERVTTKRELFSLCGKLVGHYPVCNWLRVACSFMKRETNDCGWEDCIPQSVCVMLEETMQRVKSSDPVGGKWLVSETEQGNIWCDASSLAVGVCVEVEGNVVEDACWLRKNDDNHINVTELEAIIKGLNLGIKWNLRQMNIFTDSTTVYGWVQSVICDSKRPKVAGLGEMLTRRRLSIIAELIDTYDLSINLHLVASELNIADKLTRVPKRWLAKKTCAVIQSENATTLDENAYTMDMLRDLHDTHHLGVKRTLHIAKEKWGDRIDAKDISKVVSECQTCRQVDPTPISWEKGELEVVATWQRLAADISHHNGVPYLTIIDCGPSRFAIWRKLRNETADCVAREFEQMFYERGAPSELLTDNGPCFRSQVFAKLLQPWKVKHIFSCAYRPSGNGIIERHHRTIKRMLARSGGNLQEMLYWYNHQTL